MFDIGLQKLVNFSCIKEKLLFLNEKDSDYFEIVCNMHMFGYCSLLQLMKISEAGGGKVIGEQPRNAE